MLFTFLLVFHILVCVALIIVVLMQSSKGEGLAGAFGGGALTSAVFGGRGAASFLSKATSVLAIVFMLSCMGLSLLSAGKGMASSSSTETDSAVTRTAERDAQQQATQQQAAPAEGEASQQGDAATPEDIFNTPTQGGQTPDSQ